MKPSQKQVNILYHSLQSRYDNAKLKRISNEANVFANYLNTLSGFTTIDAPHEVKHVGRVIVDGVLQLASDWNRQVGGTVRYITGVLSAATVSGFISFVQQHQRQPQTQFKVKNRETALLMVAQFFAGKGIETFDSLYKWLEPESNRDSLLTQNSGLQWGVFRIGNKTADYFRGLVGHWDAVAVDRGIRELLAAAKVISKFSNKYDYKEIRSIVQLTAVSHFDSRPLI